MLERLKELEAKATKGPWSWYIHDHSMATLYHGDPEQTPVLDVGPCRSCADKAAKEGGAWVWGRCVTPSKNDAAFIVALRNAAPLLIAVAEVARDEHALCLVKNCRICAALSSAEGGRG